MKTTLFLLALASVPALAVVPRSAFAETHSVSYEVPTANDLEAYSRYDVTYDAKKTDDGKTVLTYTLPATLVGHDKTITVSGTVKPNAASFRLHGPEADMNCVTNADSALCRVMNHVKIDLPAVKAALDASDFSADQKRGRLELATMAMREGGDLVGVMTYVKGISY
jgi:hypothetical protein